MGTPRQTGRTVALLRSALRLDTVAAMLYRIVSADFGLGELRALPPECRGFIELAPIPRAVRGRHQWEDQVLGAPTPSGGRQSGHALRTRFTDGSLTPVDRLDAVLQAHGEAGERSPFIVIDEARARAAAEASAARYAAGEPRGPLDGLLVPVKDHFHMRGLPTRGGTAYLEEPVDVDALAVRRLEEAGAIVLGKTHATEWGLNPYGVMEHFVGPRNPYDDDRGPGGSSTGAGVVVSLGWAPSAVGSDGGGSIRIPACLTGVFGLKPGYVRVGSGGSTWGHSSVSHIGPLGATVADLVDQLSTISGEDPDDVRTRWAPDGHDATPWRAALGRGVKGARIGLLRSEWEDADPAIVALLEDALRQLEREGARLVDVDLPLARSVNAIGAVVIGSETAAGVSDDYARHSAAFGHELAIFIELMKQVSGPDFLMAQRTRTALRDQTAARFADVDLLALPTTASVAPPYARSEDRTAILDTEATAAMTRFNFLGNLTGLPAGTTPMGLVEGLPVGLQLLGDAWDEASVLAAMAHCERIGLADTVPRPPASLG